MLVMEWNITGMEVGRRREEKIQEELNLWDKLLQTSWERELTATIAGDCIYLNMTPHLPAYRDCV